MLVYPSQIAKAAQDAGMKVPDNLDEFDPVVYPHFRVFCNVQLGVPVTWGNHWENAKIIAKIPDAEIRTVTMEKLEEMGFAP